ncbi:hypothetical protein ONS95_008648 [Cadophora gregata]|uniref:uncharacterized protein n=1 Tax=Cadophora gregata TaxID=51156 RepID=UPI0026DB5090|nr:uncharacterized protein ONS95_008648 [Cadophora gregata]KAK0123633.1 hypothetical protein ONS95_008648 [Cadophora gregata]KAK0129972.1 hypothetical protein ONS96_000513 [Cadophora gregata f. sp. sojae]
MSKRHIVIFSGGSAANNLVDVFGKVAEDKGCSLSYIIPISDNGGSSSELIRVFGGPGIGDVRSRLVRLIPENPSSPEITAIKTLFNHRLSPNSSLARIEWLDIVESRHVLWTSISSEKRELIRSLFNTINLEIVKRLRPTSSFNFQSASVGNLFITGARLFTGSFESAIYLLGAITGVPSHINVIPAINSNFSHHISAGLEDGTQITGQNAISHPSARSAPPPIPTPVPGGTRIGTPMPSEAGSEHENEIDPLHTSEIPSQPNQQEEDIISMSPRTLANRALSLTDHDLGEAEDANLPGSLPTLRTQNINFAKSHTEDLPSRISRIWYINPYGQEIRPAANPKVLSSIEEASTVVYSIGSLWTSIVPCLVLRDVGGRIIKAGVKYKILILNGSLDRETRAVGMEFTARDFVGAIADACASSSSASASSSSKTRSGTGVGQSPSLLGVQSKSWVDAGGRWPAVIDGKGRVSKENWRDYVSHVIHLQGEGTPRVEKEELGRLGIECVRIYGRKNEGEGGGMIYDGTALGQALDAIIGGAKRAQGVGRRNTLGVPNPLSG